MRNLLLAKFITLRNKVQTQGYKNKISSLVAAQAALLKHSYHSLVVCESRKQDFCNSYSRGIPKQPKLFEQIFAQTHKHSTFLPKVHSRVLLPSTPNHGIRLCERKNCEILLKK